MRPCFQAALRCEGMDVEWDGEVDVVGSEGTLDDTDIGTVLVETFCQRSAEITESKYEV